LREYGLGKWIKPLQELAGGQSADVQFILKIRDGKWDLYGRTAGGAAEPIDYDSNYEVDGNTVIASHEGDSNTYRWSVDGDTLTLKWLATTYRRTRGIPEVGLPAGPLYDRDVPEVDEAMRAAWARDPKVQERRRQILERWREEGLTDA
jgi:hypothetical protein